MSAVFYKDKDATLDYTVDWSAWLGEDVIDTSDWTVPDGITEVSAAKTDTTATVWLSGGTAGTDYSLTNQITTEGGRVDERTILVKVRER